MSTRLRVALAILFVLIAANIGWRIWEGWGLITVNVDQAPLADVIRTIERQGGIRLVSNAAPDAKVSMHVRKVPLVRALQVLAINTGGSWSAGYVAAPDEAAIRALLAAFASGGGTDGWKKFLLQMPPMGGGGSSDVRNDRWEVAPASEGNLQAYLAQGSEAVNAQFWVPESWNPAIAKTPGSGRPGEVVGKLARAGGGQSAEVFLLTMQGSFPPMNGAPPPNQPPRGPDGGFAGGGPPNEAMMAALEKRELARIDKLPTDKKAAALAEHEKRKKFFDEMAQLPPEQRGEKMRERIEADMNEGPNQFETRMTQFDAMHTTEQRANFFRMVLQHKQEATAK